jgi:hypothetical protein
MEFNTSCPEIFFLAGTDSKVRVLGGVTISKNMMPRSKYQGNGFWLHSLQERGAHTNKPFMQLRWK